MAELRDEQNGVLPFRVATWVPTTGDPVPECHAASPMGWTLPARLSLGQFDCLTNRRRAEVPGVGYEFVSTT